MEAERTTDPLARLLELGLEPQRALPASNAIRIDRDRQQVRAACAAMGTRVSITALDGSRQRLDDAIADAFEEMERLIAIFSRFESSSAITQLNAAGQLDGPPPELTHVLGRALRYHSLTRGAFDVTVAPLLDLFRARLKGATPRPPSDAEIREVRALVGAHHVVAGRRALRLGRAGMGVTLDGIAKGYIVDRMAAALDTRHVRNYLIDGGGDIRARGRNPRGRPWTVAVKAPEGDGFLPGALELSEGAVATSGSYERSFDADQRFHHIVDAGTGRSPTGCASVSIVAPTTMLADVLATSVFVMGPEDGLAFVETSTICECLIVDRSGRELRSRGWKTIATDNDPTE